ncbi:hypothetical protein EBL84_10520 [Marichromatium sp. AB31]|nr:hypothetical protein EBL84_10520 [Marichromatium sp. AB31]
MGREGTDRGNHRADGTRSARRQQGPAASGQRPAASGQRPAGLNRKDTKGAKGLCVQDPSAGAVPYWKLAAGSRLE